jgi:uncharacterized membrane protein YozB (DUF420 family)
LAILPRLMNDALATLAFVLLALGWTQRRNRARHVPLVLSGIALDLALVVWLEISRGVVEKVAGAEPHVPFPAVRWAHIASSTLAVVAYVPTLWLGFRMLRSPGDAALRRRHAAVAVTALILRTIGFLCMWGVEASK